MPLIINSDITKLIYSNPNFICAQNLTAFGDGGSEQ
jgi:hypothetical protein